MRLCDGYPSTRDAFVNPDSLWSIERAGEGAKLTLSALPVQVGQTVV
jgi:hypothetical protein